MTTTAKFLNLSDITTSYFKGGTKKNINNNMYSSDNNDKTYIKHNKIDQNLNVYQKIIRSQNSSRSFMLSYGIITVFIPARCAARAAAPECSRVL